MYLFFAPPLDLDPVDTNVHDRPHEQSSSLQPGLQPGVQEYKPVLHSDTQSFMYCLMLFLCCKVGA